jgi:hypothetical protein
MRCSHPTRPGALVAQLAVTNGSTEESLLSGRIKSFLALRVPGFAPPLQLSPARRW